MGRRKGEDEAVATAKNLRISPRKLNSVAELIRGKRCDKALLDLEFSTRRISKDVKKTLQSAIANAENNHDLDLDLLYVKEATVGKSIVMRRFRPRARGRVGRIRKPFSHLRLVVREQKDTA
jgi:large subunit ribosomal protein L22